MNKTNECGGTVCSYERLLLSVYASRPLTEVLKMISHIAVLFSVFVYGVRVATVDLWGAVRFIVLTAIPFLAVTLLRRLIDAPRPYELIAFYAPAPPKKKKGKGFPSRHVFSLFLITVMSFPVLPILSSVLLILGIALAVSRVLLGIHFLRDVIAGAAIGIASGGIGLLVLWLI